MPSGAVEVDICAHGLTYWRICKTPLLDWEAGPEAALCCQSGLGILDDAAWRSDRAEPIEAGAYSVVQVVGDCGPDLALVDLEAEGGVSFSDLADAEVDGGGCGLGHTVFIGAKKIAGAGFHCLDSNLAE